MPDVSRWVFSDRRPCRLALVETHPIQYKVGWFRRLAARPEIQLRVYYALIPDATQQGAGFGVPFEWDQPLLEGYPHEVMRNVAAERSVERFGGCDTPDLYRIISRASPRWDAVIVNGWVVKTCLQALAACRLAGVPCVVRGESNALRQRSSWKRWVHRALLAQYERVLYIGNSNREFYRRNGVPEWKLFFGPYGVDNDLFSREAARWWPARDELRVAWKIQPEAFCLVFSGKMVPKKRPLDLLESLRLVVTAHGCRRPVHLLMVGDGALRGTCEEFASGYGLPVTFTGFLNQGEIPKAYAVSDCLVLPSDDGETWGLVVNEAMASGLPAIVSDRVGCHPDLVQSGVTGHVFPLGRPDLLARCIVEVANRDDRGAAMGSVAREHVAGYSVDKLVEGTLACLASLPAR